MLLLIVLQCWLAFALSLLANSILMWTAKTTLTNYSGTFIDFILNMIKFLLRQPLGKKAFSYLRLNLDKEKNPPICDRNLFIMNDAAIKTHSICKTWLATD